MSHRVAGGDGRRREEKRGEEGRREERRRARGRKGGREEFQETNLLFPYKKIQGCHYVARLIVLDESDVLSSLSEALSAHINLVLTDDSAVR